MTAYTEQSWNNGQAGGTPISAARLQHMESGVGDLSDEFGEHYFNVKDFGAVGDGVTIDTVAIQAAINACTGRVRKVFLPAGIYKIDAPLVIDVAHQGIEIFGVGQYRDTIGSISEIRLYGPGAMFQNGSDDALAEDSIGYNGPQGFTLRGLHMKPSSGTFTSLGNNIGGGASYYSGTYGVRDYRGGGIVLEHVMMEQFEYGFYCHQSDYNRFHDVEFKYCATGVRIGPRSDQGYYSALNFVYCQRAIECVRPKGCLFLNPSVAACGSPTRTPIAVIPGSYSDGSDAVVFDTPWLEMDPALTTGTIEAWFEIGGTTAAPTGVVEIRNPFMANWPIAGAVVNEVAHLVKVGNMSHPVIITGPTGPGAANFTSAFVKAVGSTSPSVVLIGATAVLTGDPLLNNAGTGTPGVMAYGYDSTGLTLKAAGAAVLWRFDGAGATITLGDGATAVAIEAKTGSGSLRFRIGSTEIFRIDTSSLTMAEGKNVAVGTTTGTKIGTGTTQKLGFWNVTPVVQPAANPDTSGATLANLEIEVNQLKALLRSVGFMAP